MVGQAQVAVGAQHQDLLALNDDLGVLRRRNGAEIGVKAQRADLGGGLEITDFVQKPGPGMRPDLGPNRMVIQVLSAG